MAKRPGPKPSGPPPGLVDDLFAHMHRGGSVRGFARDHKLDEGTLRRWATEAAPTQYARAREAQAHALYEDIDELARRATGLPAEYVQGYRLAIDAKKWQASKLAPRSYGDRQTVEHEGAVGLTVTYAREGRRGG